MAVLEQESARREAALRRAGADAVAGLLRMTTGARRAEALYARHRDAGAAAFIDAVLRELRIDMSVEERDGRRLPETGGVVVVANHPYGIVDQLVLLRLALALREDVRLLTPGAALADTPLQALTLPEQAFPGIGDSAGAAPAGLDAATAHVAAGGLLVVLPAAAVSTFQAGSRGVADGPWRTQVLRMVRAAGVPVVPVYVHGTNSVLFHVLGVLHPRLGDARLPAELFNKNGQTVRLRVGTPVPVTEQERFSSVAQYGRYLRALTYALGTTLPVKRFFRRPAQPVRAAREIIPPVPADALAAELDALPEDDLLFTHSRYRVYCSAAPALSAVLTEIGRLREVTFRAAGEGTQAECDNDEYDLTYRHLFIWDAEARCIVGAYRLAHGWEIAEQYGVKGFYIHSLFKIRKPLLPVLAASVELGRSFVAPAYQQKPWPLFLLWKGILHVIERSPECRYLIGPVSISNNYSRFSRSLMVAFIQDRYYNESLARYVKPRKRFRFATGAADPQVLADSGPDTIEKLDRLVEHIEPGMARLPVLLKKYLKQNARIIGFNLDPRFSDALDGLMILDVRDLPESMARTLSREARVAATDRPGEAASPA